MDVEELRKELQAQRTENQELRKELQAQRDENQVLRNDLAKALEGLEQTRARIKQLEGQVAKDSHNSSKPPSSNGFKEPVRKTASLREKSGKKSGGQPGHPGKTLMVVEHPDRTVQLTPPQCRHCHHNLSQAPVCRTERVQEFDLPSVSLS